MLLHLEAEEDGGRGYEPRNASNEVLEAGKGKEMDSSLNPVYWSVFSSEKAPTQCIDIDGGRHGDNRDKNIDRYAYRYINIYDLL